MAENCKRFRRSFGEMNIESLLNELLLNCFKYLSTSDLVRSFSGLNCRIDLLLSDYFRVRGINFQFISKDAFDTICRRYLPRLIDQISSIRLVDDESTPGQIKEFLNQNFMLHQFIHLQSISVNHLRSEA
jgi:hypothetical protein